MAVVNLAADYGWGPYSLLLIFLITVSITMVGLVIVVATSRIRKKQSFASKTKHHPETYWAIGVAAILVWLWIISYPWMPPVASSVLQPGKEHIQVVDVTAGQWFWLMDKSADGSLKAVKSPVVTLIAGQPVKFTAHSIDVNHGFGVFAGQSDGSSLLFQMQVIPGFDNIFYYTFKHPGIYLVRCLEYCGYAHPYMTSEIKVVAPGSTSGVVST
jgi:cytochrome c oxidase subunit 2